MLAEILNFQGAKPIWGMGSLSHWIKIDVFRNPYYLKRLFSFTQTFFSFWAENQLTYCISSFFFVTKVIVFFFSVPFSILYDSYRFYGCIIINLYPSPFLYSHNLICQKYRKTAVFQLTISIQKAAGQAASKVFIIHLAHKLFVNIPTACAND